MYIYTSTLRCRGNSRCLKKLGHIDQEMVQIRANIVCFLKISEVYFSPRPWLPIKARTHTLSSPGPAQRPQPRLGSQFDTWLDCGLVKEVKLPYSSRANWRRYCPRIFWIALMLMDRPVLPVLQLLAVREHLPIKSSSLQQLAPKILKEDANIFLTSSPNMCSLGLNLNDTRRSCTPRDANAQ